MVRQNGKCHAWYCAAGTALLIAALFYGCAGEKENNDQKSANMKTTIDESRTDTGDGTFPGLDAKTEKQIRQDYWDLLIKKGFGSEFLEHGITVDSIRIDRYYGTYNGYAVVIMDRAMVAVVWSREIGGIYFEEGSPPNSRIAQEDQRGMIAGWKDGRFYDIADLYEEGLLTLEDLKQIAERQAVTL
jgi:hypothetical protein